MFTILKQLVGIVMVGGTALIPLIMASLIVIGVFILPDWLYSIAATSSGLYFIGRCVQLKARCLRLQTKLSWAEKAGQLLKE